VPLPTLICLAFATGIAAALAGRVELRVSPRPALLTRSFMAYVVFACFVLVPVAVYFYVFHGDWFLLYTVDVATIPSALALVGFAVLVGIGAAGFLLGSVMVRSQRDTLAGVLTGLAVIAAGAVIFVAKERLQVVGDFTQYRGQFGLEPFAEGPLVQGAMVMGGILLVGILALVTRLHLSGRRGD
tara:strand:+ start:1866 stop:2420 length:555 start_codon:yes stop_codon:yes gene_type:complete